MEFLQNFFHPWNLVAAFLTFCIFSFLYKDNPFYKFAEHLFVGVSLGYSTCIILFNAFIPKVVNPLFTDFSGHWHLLIAVILGLMYFFRFIPKYRWLIRFPMAIQIGFTAGISVTLRMDARLFKQLKFTIAPLDNIYTIIVLIGVISVLIYFLFTFERKGILRPIAKLGTIFLMIGFGATFGNTVMARISLLIGRISFLLQDWLHILK
ncbi:MAG: hypothetical protein PHV06_06995 [bacterium]|nr:hypothetical protein [bacterium]